MNNEPLTLNQNQSRVTSNQRLIYPLGAILKELAYLAQVSSAKLLAG